MAEGMPKSWAEQLADIDDPVTRDIDPEDVDEVTDYGSEDEYRGKGDARAHYVDVDQSKFRKKNDLQDLGARYAGSSVARDALEDKEEENNAFRSQEGNLTSEESEDEEYADPDKDVVSMEVDGDEEIDSDEAFESGDEERFQDYQSKGSEVSEPGKGSRKATSKPNGRKPVKDTYRSEDDFGGFDSDSSKDEDEDMTASMNQDNSADSSESDSDETSISSDQDSQKDNSRAELRKLMAESQTNLTSSLSQAAKADISKGRAIKRQRTAFDSLLNTRIKLQKALIATNSMSTSTATAIPTEHTKAITAAEKAALDLWTNLSSLRSSLLPPFTPTPQPLTATPTTPSPHLHEHMQRLESPHLPHRRSTLEKWSQKTRRATSLPNSKKFSQPSTEQPLTSLLDYQFSGSQGEKLLQKTRVPRSCAPVQSAARVTEDAGIYDDADFYTLLLRELVDQRMADPSSTTTSAPNITNGIIPPISGAGSNKHPFKVKKAVDTKASKGRKMRYGVHEKLLNFMAPLDLGRWGDRQREELFGGLLGRRMGVGEEGDEGGDDMEGEEGREEGLRLFG
ncbi:rRNA-processing protein bfr2 [Lecanora helva]